MGELFCPSCCAIASDAADREKIIGTGTETVVMQEYVMQKLELTFDTTKENFGPFITYFPCLHGGKDVGLGLDQRNGASTEPAEHKRPTSTGLLSYELSVLLSRSVRLDPGVLDFHTAVQLICTEVSPRSRCFY